MSDEIRRNSSYESHNSSGYSPNYPDDTVEIVVSKIKGELIGKNTMNIWSNTIFIKIGVIFEEKCQVRSLLKSKIKSVHL